MATMTLVLSVMAASILVSSMFIVSGRTSTNTSLAPASTAAVAVLEKVKLGRMTSSPGWRPHSSIAISSAVVPLVVSSTFWVWKRSSIQLLHILVKAPSPQILWASMACLTYSSSSPTQGGTLKGIMAKALFPYKIRYLLNSIAHYACFHKARDHFFTRVVL